MEMLTSGKYSLKPTLEEFILSFLGFSFFLCFCVVFLKGKVGCDNSHTAIPVRVNFVLTLCDSNAPPLSQFSVTANICFLCPTGIMIEVL